MTNLTFLNSFKSKKVNNPNTKYYSLLGANELLTEATFMISEILDDKISDELLISSKYLVKEMKNRARSSSNLTSNAIFEISRQLDENISRYSLLFKNN